MKHRITIFLLCFLFFLVPTYARADWVGLNYGVDNDQARLNNTMSSAPYLNTTGIFQMLGTACAIFPFFGPDNCTNDKNIQASLLKKSAIGNIAMAMGSMYDNPPADLAYWIRDTGQSLGFIPKQAYAQGVGFTGLAPLLPIWKAFRNIAYVLLALAMIVVGFMVMMRKRIDPKTVVTVQNSLPRIVIALILITFSYAIVGLLIDVMYLVIAFVTLIIKSNLQDAMPFGINYVSGGFWDLFVAVFAPLPKWLVGDVLVDVQQGQWVEFFKDYVGGMLSGKFLFGSLFLLIVSLAYLFAFVRMLFMLLGAYVQILLAVLTGPIQILADVFPGANAFGEWIKNLVANLVTFPITVFLLMIANVLNQHIGEQALWVPPFLPQGAGGLAETLISLGIIMTIPNIVNSLKEAFKAKALIGGSTGGGMGGAVTALSTLYYAQAMTPQVIKDRVSQLFGGKPKIE